MLGRLFSLACGGEVLGVGDDGALCLFEGAEDGLLVGVGCAGHFCAPEFEVTGQFAPLEDGDIEIASERPGLAGQRKEVSEQKGLQSPIADQGEGGKEGGDGNADIGCCGSEIAFGSAYVWSATQQIGAETDGDLWGCFGKGLHGGEFRDECFRNSSCQEREGVHVAVDLRLDVGQQCAFGRELCLELFFIEIAYISDGQLPCDEELFFSRRAIFSRMSSPFFWKPRSSM